MPTSCPQRATSRPRAGVHEGGAQGRGAAAVGGRAVTRGWRALFLKPGGYRRRRLHDAARLLPVIGGFLLLLPILWAPAATEARDTAPDGIYLFLVWAALIAAAAVMAGRLGAEVAGEAAEAAGAAGESAAAAPDGAGRPEG